MCSARCAGVVAGGVTAAATSEGDIAAFMPLMRENGRASLERDPATSSTSASIRQARHRRSSMSSTTIAGLSTRNLSPSITKRFDARHRVDDRRQAGAPA
jgi:hypothetical protein